MATASDFDSAGISDFDAPRTVSTCFLDPTMSKYLESLDGFTDRFLPVFLHPFEVMFAPLAGLMIVIIGVQIILHLKDVQQGVINIFWIVLAAGLLNLQGVTAVKENMETVLEIAGAGASMIMRTANTGEDATGNYNAVIGMKELVCQAEKGVTNVMGLGGTIAGEASISNFGTPILYAILLIIPFLLITYTYLTQVVVSVFRVTFITVMAPYLLMSVGFGFLRGQIQAYLTSTITTVLTLWSSTMAVALILNAVRAIGEDITDKIQTAPDTVSIFNAEFVMILAIGWLGVPFITEATQLVSQWISSRMSNDAAAAIGATGGRLANQARSSASGIEDAKNTTF
jgi:type IV secretion system protein TrbL